MDGVSARAGLCPTEALETHAALKHPNKKAPPEIKDQSGAFPLPFDACPSDELHTLVSMSKWTK
jgi:hypothetical protein